MKNNLMILFVFQILTISLLGQSIGSKDQSATDSLYWYRILSNGSSHHIYISINIQTIDFEGRILITRNLLYSLYIKKILPTMNKSNYRDFYIDMLRILINNQSIVLKNDSIENLLQFGIIKLNKSIFSYFDTISLEDINQNYFERITESWYKCKLEIKDINIFNSLICYLINKRKFVFVDCFSGVLSYKD